MAKEKSKKRIDEQIPQDRPPAFRPDQAGGSIGGFGKKLTPSKKFLLKTKERGFFDKKVKVIDRQIPVTPKQKVNKLKTEKDISRILGKKARVEKIEKQIPPSQQTKLRQKTEPIRQVDYKTQVQQQTNPIYNNPSVTAKVKQQPDIFLTQQEVSNLSRNMYFKPTGTVLPTKPFVVGSKVLAVGMGGKTIVELSPGLLPQKEQDEIKVLPQTDELEIQKVIEEKQTLTPQEISDLAQQTQPATVTTPVPDERKTQILTKDKEKKEDVNPFEEPFEDQLEDTGLADDLEDDTDIVEEPDEIEREVIEEPDIERPEVEEIEVGGEIDLEEEINPFYVEEYEGDPMTEPGQLPIVLPDPDLEPDPVFDPDPDPDPKPVPDPDLITVPDPDPEPEPDPDPDPDPIPVPDLDLDIDNDVVTPPPPRDDVVTPPPPPDKVVVTPPPQPDKVTKRKPPKKKKKIKLKSEQTENIFKTQKGKRPNIVNFKTRKGFFQANFKKGTVQAAPKGITLDTNQGFREDSMKVITKTEAATKFKTRRDPLKALERKGII